MDRSRHHARVGCCLLALLVAASGGSSARADPGARLATAKPAFREVTLSGFTRARARLRLVAETPGRVEAVYADIGDRIPEEGIFARIDDTFIRLELEEIRVEQERLRSQIQYDRREVERYKGLVSERNASASQLDSLEQTLRDNGHALRALGVKERILAERLKRTRVRAPAGWQVNARSVEPGQWVGEGESVGEASDFSRLLVPFALAPEQHAALTALSNAIRLELPDLGKAAAAVVYRTNPDFDPETRKIGVELELLGELEPRRGGLRAVLSLPLPERSGAVMLPAAAVERSYEEHWVTREDGERIRVAVLGRTEGTNPPLVRIASPRITAGDRFRLQRAD
jgi:RND family efflux transporter MFP subunit